MRLLAHALLQRSSSPSQCPAALYVLGGCRQPRCRELADVLHLLRKWHPAIAAARGEHIAQLAGVLHLLREWHPRADFASPHTPGTLPAVHAATLAAAAAHWAQPGMEEHGDCAVMRRLLLNGRLDMPPSFAQVFPYLVGHEYRTPTGMGDLLFTNGWGIYAAVEAKSVPAWRLACALAQFDSRNEAQRSAESRALRRASSKRWTARAQARTCNIYRCLFIRPGFWGNWGFVAFHRDCLPHACPSRVSRCCRAPLWLVRVIVHMDSTCALHLKTGTQCVLIHPLKSINLSTVTILSTTPVQARRYADDIRHTLRNAVVVLPFTAFLHPLALPGQLDEARQAGVPTVNGQRQEWEGMLGAPEAEVVLQCVPYVPCVGEAQARGILGLQPQDIYAALELLG